jgi:hypothetical protein
MNKVRVLAICFNKGHVKGGEVYPLLVIRTDQYDRFINLTGCQLGKHGIVLNARKVLEALAENFPEAAAMAAEYGLDHESRLRFLETTAEIYDPYKKK